MKIDLHVHTSEISACGVLSGHETVDLYVKAGYDAIVITNHFAKYNSDRFTAAGIDFFPRYKQAFEETRAYGAAQGLKVFCGYELRFNESDNDYLVYGMSDEVASRCDEWFAMSPRAFSQVAKEQDFLFYQAHPFRNGMKVVNPAYLFGIEVRNGNPRHDSRNDIAAMWANRFGLHRIGGSDCHQEEDVGRSGIETWAKVESMADLVQVLKSDNYRII